MSNYADRANKRIEAALHAGMDAGEVDEIVNRIYRQEAEKEEEQGEQTPAPALFSVGGTVQFTRRLGYGLDWINLGHFYGRVEGVHWYGQWVYDLQKLARDENSGELVAVGTRLQGVKIYMVPEYALEALA